MTAARWERWAGIAGLVFFATLLGTFFLPSTPELSIADSELGPAIAADARGLGANVYLLGLGAVAFAVFASGVASRIRAAEGERAASSIGVLVGAVVFVSVMLVSAGVSLALIAAASEGRNGAAVRALFELDNVLFVPAGFALAVFLLSTAVGVVATSALPAWLGWTAGALGVVFLVASLGVMSADDEGGPLGFVFFVDLMLTMLWVLAAAVMLLREPRPAPTPVARRVPSPLV
jgi:hypothetical protein